jgi:hypothetical protein
MSSPKRRCKRIKLILPTLFINLGAEEKKKGEEKMKSKYKR